MGKKSKRKPGDLFSPHRHGSSKHGLHRKESIALAWHRSRRLRLLYFSINNLFLKIEVGKEGSSPRRARRVFREPNSRA
jgi:hypothetical protein